MCLKRKINLIVIHHKRHRDPEQTNNLILSIS